ncbi:MFS general substrate transporter [Wallemia mellicola]|uniref:MFS general substrate transporter n=1 Tax=Wallemia mellicola TaxID=1708541 RepID=A0A4T0PGY2_9BASI|nr:MFS general substrate transporter [Wallemia mellicola]TIC09028.1 MFS general substrate transporter [Wallemia mellicola]TIC09330.1 MFS general substrate transporter [Wallemia mellicola]TIC27776.1 MFS general substrate transporter [Wallemia mellicola]TIC50783.1 MFS general substrate transporter [Wallemia mellicola]
MSSSSLDKQSLKDEEQSETSSLSNNHIFQQPEIAQYWSKIYENAKYENRHRFDPEFTWTPEEEKKVLRKTDLKILVFCIAMFFSLDLIRQNLKRAVSDNLLSELGMDQNDYNNGNTIFFLTFLAMELPSGLISKKVGADKWVPAQIIAWSIVNAAQVGMNNRTGFYVLRAMLGICQGGFIPDVLLYLSYFYTSAELNIRVGWWYTVLGFSQVIGTLLAAGFIELRGLHGLSGWKYLFAFESLITGVIGILSIFLMPSGPTQMAGILRGKKGYFTEREEKIIVNKILRDTPNKGDLNNRDGINWSNFVKAITDYDLWPIYILGLVVYIPYQPSQNYITLILKQLGFSTFESNVLLIPYQVLFAIFCVLVSWLSKRVKEHGFVSTIANVWTLPPLVALFCLPQVQSNYYNWVRYALNMLISSFPYIHPQMIAWLSENSKSVGSRAVSLCIYNMTYQIGSIGATRIYTDADKPYYEKGTAALIGICSVSILLPVLAKAYYIARNRYKLREWNKMTPEQQLEYSITTTDIGSKRLDMLFTH